MQSRSRTRTRGIQNLWLFQNSMLEEEIHLILFQFVWQLTTMHSVSNN